jgi:hypothetical protein
MMVGMKAILLIAALAFTGPAAYAAEFPPAMEQAERDLREGLEKVLRAVEGFVKSIPVYEAPYMDDKGDIIIRRKPPEPEKRDRVEPQDPSRT